MKPLRWTLWVSLSAVLLAAASYAAERAANFRLTGVDGKTYELKQVASKGKAVLLNFWEVNCKPCKQEMPQIQRIYETYQPAGLRVLVISRDTSLTLSRVKPFVASQKWDFPVLLDPELKVSKDYHVKFSPVNILISAKGEILYRHNGYKPGNEDELERAVVKALKLTSDEVTKLKVAYEKSEPTLEPAKAKSEEAASADDGGDTNDSGAES
ncbi:MAG: hypothetical protein B1H03_05570 [Planctomycetales bacterium 4484_113]|nr:MAG: hypothetical protein B1H03_05570 [Planctomycetales bacterium 4484_113]